MPMKVLVAGDYAPVYYRLKDQIEAGDFEKALGEVKPLTGNADFSIVNFETSIADPEKTRPILKLGPTLHACENAMKGLKWAGFNVVTLANNHIMDYGPEGLKNVLRLSEENGIATVGAGENLEEASGILYLKSAEQTVAVINCCEHEFSIAGDDVPGAYPLDPVQQYRQIKSAREKADYVLVIVHGGSEHYQLPTRRMQELYRFFIEAGADVVMNHHQHCFSGYEIYDGKPIFYGLGNFCFDEKGLNHGLWTQGFMVEIDFKSEIGFRIIPYVQYEKEATLHVLPEGAYDKQIGNLNSIIANPTELKMNNLEYFEKNSEAQRIRMEPFDCRYIKALQRRKLFPLLIGKRKLIELKNIIACESHRDKLLYMLDNKIITSPDLSKNKES